MMRTLVGAACLAVALPAAAANSAQGVDAAWQKAASSNDLRRPSAASERWASTW